MDRDVIPAGSQRGLAALRIAADEAAAERGCYAGLMTVTSAFAAPEQAAVAAFERIDLVEVDPIREIVEHNVDPERALADQAFAHRLHTRAGSLVVTGAGPLAIGPDIAGGVPAEATTSMGRALALEALGVEIALADGLPAGSLMVGAVPAWVAQEGDSRSMLVQVRLRRLLFPELRLVIHGLASDGPAGNWAAPLVAALTGAPASLVLWDRTGDNASEAAAIHHAAAGAGAALRSGLGNGALHGDAAEQAKRTLEAAVVALERLAAEGWDSVLGPSGGGREPARFGGAAVVERALGPASAAGLLADLF